MRTFWSRAGISLMKVLNRFYLHVSQPNKAENDNEVKKSSGSSSSFSNTPTEFIIYINLYMIFLNFNINIIEDLSVF